MAVACLEHRFNKVRCAGLYGGEAVNRWLVRRLLLPLHERLRGRTTLIELRALRQLEPHPEQLERLRQRKLAELLTHCRRAVHYYRQCLGLPSAEGMTPGDAAAVAGAPTLDEFPILERDTVRQQGAQLLAEGFTGVRLPASTGGSSGQPLQFWTDQLKEIRHNAQKLRFRQWLGVEPGDRQVDFWGSPIELEKSSRLRRYKDRYLLNQTLCSAHDLTPERIDHYARFLGSFRPQLVYGYPTVIYRVARYCSEQPQLLGNWRPRAVVCTSEMLYPQLREGIRAGLGAEVFNEYGSRDGGLIAHECRHGRLHIAAEHVWVEVDPAQTDEDGVGDLLITNLDGYAMPFVRYRVGDRGRLSDEACPCGSPLPVLERLEGRRNDFLIGGGGRRVHGSAANYVLRECPEVIQYRLVQRRDCSIDIQIVATDEWGQTSEQAIASGVRRILGLDTEVRLERVAAIPPAPSGKYRWVESEVDSTWN